MRIGIRLLAGVFVLAALPMPSLAQGPPPPPPPPPPMGMPAGGPAKTGTAKLSGRVTALDTGRPIRRAVVSAMGGDLREGKSVSTDVEGRWELRDLPAGRFSVSVSKGGYVTLSYGQRRPFEPGKTVELKDKQALEKIDVALPRASAITGRVVDEFGDPVTGVRVSPMRYRFSAGQRRLTVAGGIDSTDDLGQFRLFGLAPGDYYVLAQPSNLGSFISASDDRSGYAQTYFPGAYSPAAATRLTLTIGQEAQNTLISLVPSRLARLSGTITKADGKPITAGMVRLQDAGAGPTSMNMGIVRPDGSWSISGVVPGEYRLTAQLLDRSFEEIGATGTSGIGPTQFAQMDVSVSGEDIGGLALVASTGGSAQGTIQLEGAPPARPPGGVTIIAADASNTGFGAGAAGTVKPDGSFQITGLIGKRILRPIGLPQGWALKSIMLDGTDVTDTGVEIPAGGQVEGIEIHLTQKAAELSGTVQTAKGTATSDYVVLLFSPDADKWGWLSRFVRMVRPDQTGRFVIDGLTAAPYLAVALEYVEPGEEGNPEFLESLRTTATKVTIAEGEKKTLTLKLASSTPNY